MRATPRAQFVYQQGITSGASSAAASSAAASSAKTSSRPSLLPVGTAINAHGHEGAFLLVPAAASVSLFNGHHEEHELWERQKMIEDRHALRHEFEDSDAPRPEKNPVGNGVKSRLTCFLKGRCLDPKGMT